MIGIDNPKVSATRRSLRLPLSGMLLPLIIIKEILNHISHLIHPILRSDYSHICQNLAWSRSRALIYPTLSVAHSQPKSCIQSPSTTILVTLHTSATVPQPAFVSLTDARNLVPNHHYLRCNGVIYSSHNEGMAIFSYRWWYRSQYEAQR